MVWGVTRRVQCQATSPTSEEALSAPVGLRTWNTPSRAADHAPDTPTMQSLRRTAVTAAQKGRTTLPRQPRRFAHDEHAHGHGHAPVNEPMGVSQASRLYDTRANTHVM
jgi:hypothetical protein